MYSTKYTSKHTRTYTDYQLGSNPEYQLGSDLLTIFPQSNVFTQGDKRDSSELQATKPQCGTERPLGGYGVMTVDWLRNPQAPKPQCGCSLEHVCKSLYIA